MKITEFKTHEFKTMERDYRGKYGYWIYPVEILKTEPSEATTTLVELVTDTGVSGYWIPRGGAPAPWIQELAIGRDPLDRQWFWQLSRGDMALDMLLWDFAGRYFEQPVHKLLGSYRDKIKCYASSYPNMGPPETFADHAQACVERGYRAYKIHAYMWYDPINMEPAPRSPAFPKQDVDVCRAVRERVGDDIVLMLDQAGIYNYEEALYVGRELEELNFFWFESPMPENNIEPYIRLTENLNVPVCAPEQLGNLPYSRTEWIVRKAADMGRTEVNFNGITGCAKSVALYESFGMRATIHGGGWGNLQIYASTDVNTIEYFERGLLAPGFDEAYEVPPPYMKEICDPFDGEGNVLISQKPGLGFELNWDYIDDNRV
ncbi:MAG: enolase [Candidatus Latescibacteria bacterium]|nr:enolase [Candidatus Latescibacterota bacterium]